MPNAGLPIIIQGGMGAGVSSWSLAKAVAMTGQLGVVSGTAIDVIVARRLEVGDPGGHVRRALSHFPIPGVAQRILDRYFVPGGKPSSQPFTAKPVPSIKPSRALLELIVAGNFVEVFLAKEGHEGKVGINYLEKIQLPTLPSLYGAMLAGVSCVLMGAGIPRAIPGIMDRLSRREAVELRIDVEGAAPGEEFHTHFDPATFWPEGPTELARPDFYAIIASATLGSMLARKASGKVNGFIIEGPTAGGHNAPPRGPLQLTNEGEPIYGERDVVDLEAIRALGLPFWLAGSYADPARVTEALQAGAAGVQVGTAFAYCEESGLDADIRRKVLELSAAGKARVFTDPVASPTGFPFKILPLAGTIYDPNGRPERHRICDLGYLRHAYKTEKGTVSWRCPSEPIDDYIRKGGSEEDTRGRLCVCNGLMANIGLEQVRPEHRHASLNGATPAPAAATSNGHIKHHDDGELFRELPLITSGDDVATVARFLKPGATTYHAADVVEHLLSGVNAMADAEAIVPAGA